MSRLDRFPLAVGCDVGGTAIKAAALRRGRILATVSVPTPAGGRERAIAAIAEAARSCARTAEAAGREPAALGVALPGFLDRARARPVHLSNVPALDGAPLRAVLGRRLGCPVVLDADSNAGAFGEWRLGAGRGARRLIYVALGTGVGAAMVAGGEVVRVSHHTVGQVAHLPLDPRGPRCRCGARGCAESVLDAAGILWRARRAGVPAAERADPRRLFDAARSGSRSARRALAETGALLGAALAVLANLFSPDRIVVGGGIAGAGDLILAPATRAFAARVQPRLRGKVAIAAAGLGPFAGAAGAALLALRARADRAEAARRARGAYDARIQEVRP